MSEDLGSLALVIDDPLAPRLVAFWRTKKPSLEAFTEVKFQQSVARTLRIRDLDGLRVTFENCESIGLLVDGGISTLAEKWLTASVALGLGIKQQPPKAKQAQPKPAKAPSA